MHARSSLVVTTGVGNGLMTRTTDNSTKDYLGDLDGVGGGSLAEVVADAPEEKGVGSAQVLADPADEDVVLAGGIGRQRIALGRGSSTTVTPGALAQFACLLG